MIRVHLVENHAIVRQGLVRIINEQTDLEVVAESESAEEALQARRRLSWDVTILDLSLPGRSGIDTVEAMRESLPDVPVLILTMHEPEVFAVQVMCAGAAGYLTKDCSTETLVEAIRTIHQGKKYLVPDAASVIADALRRDDHRPQHDKLSPREMEVLLMTARGFSAIDMSTTLHIAASTVDSYRRRIVEKLGLGSVREIPAYAYKNNLME